MISDIEIDNKNIEDDGVRRSTLSPRPQLIPCYLCNIIIICYCNWNLKKNIWTSNSPFYAFLFFAFLGKLLNNHAFCVPNQLSRNLKSVNSSHCHCSLCRQLMNVDYDYDYFALGSIWSEGWQVLDRLQSTTKLIIWIDRPATSSTKQSWSRTALKRSIKNSQRSTAENENWPLEFLLKLRQSVDQDHWETRQQPEQLIGPSDSTAIAWNSW